MKDYQWPHAIFAPKEKYHADRSRRERDILTRDIESFFAEKFGTEAILVSSGRSAVSLLLRLRGINRSHIVYVPKWTSTCMFDAIGHVSNPSTIYSDECDVIVAVHKWGKTVRFDKRPKGYVIEDSVDSLINDPSALFPNDGAVEIFSLPKILGTYTGGIIAVRDNSLAAEIRRALRGADEELARYQSKLRFEAAKGKDTKFVSWLHMEYLNFALDYHALTHIRNALPRYEENRKCIERRLGKVKEAFVDIEVSPGRLPPLIPLEKAKYPIKDGTDVMARHYSWSGRIEKPEYKEAYLIPLHFGVGDDWFQEMLRLFRA